MRGVPGEWGTWECESWVRARSDWGTWERQSWVRARGERGNKKAWTGERGRGVSACSRTFHDGIDGTLRLPGSCTCAKAREEVRSNPLTEGTQRNTCTKEPPSDLACAAGARHCCLQPSPPARRSPAAACSSTTGCRPPRPPVSLQQGRSSELAPACDTHLSARGRGQAERCPARLHCAPRRSARQLPARWCPAQLPQLHL